ncbi:hypothetical protein SNEBB_009176 [Seison nebaliae]|nr:hypothetical protein SNEBB_009176 [Seison nebaliae]
MLPKPNPYGKNTLNPPDTVNWNRYYFHTEEVAPRQNSLLQNLHQTEVRYTVDNLYAKQNLGKPTRASVLRYRSIELPVLKETKAQKLAEKRKQEEFHRSCMRIRKRYSNNYNKDNKKLHKFMVASRYNRFDTVDSNLLLDKGIFISRNDPTKVFVKPKQLEKFRERMNHEDHMNFHSNKMINNIGHTDDDHDHVDVLDEKRELSKREKVNQTFSLDVEKKDYQRPTYLELGKALENKTNSRQMKESSCQTELKQQAIYVPKHTVPLIRKKNDPQLITREELEKSTIDRYDNKKIVQTAIQIDDIIKNRGEGDKIKPTIVQPNAEDNSRKTSSDKKMQNKRTVQFSANDKLSENGDNLLMNEHSLANTFQGDVKHFVDHIVKNSITHLAQDNLKISREASTISYKTVSVEDFHRDGFEGK